MMPAIPTFSLLQGLDGIAKAAPETAVDTDLFSALVECLGEAAHPTAAAVGAPPLDHDATLPKPSVVSLPTTPAPVEGRAPEAGDRERQGDEAGFPQAALIAVLAAQLPAAPAIAVSGAAAANAPNLPVNSLDPPPTRTSSSGAAAEVATLPARQAEASLPQLPVLLVAEPDKAAHRPNRPLDRPAPAAAPAPSPQAAAVPEPGAIEQSVPGPQMGVAQPGLAAEAPAAAPDHIAMPAVLEQQVERHLDLARESEWLDSLARDIVRAGEGGGALRFRLHPESLGSLAVEISQGAGGASVRLTTESEAARAIVADAQPRLMAEARAQGLRIAETHVDIGSGGHAAPEDRRGRHGAAGEILVRTSGEEAADKAAPPPTVRNLAERYA